MCLPICGSHAFAQKAESYAVFDEATNTLTFKHDNNKPAGAFELNEGTNAPGWYKPNGSGGNKNYINKVVFDASFAKARPTSCCSWFRSCSDLKIEGIKYLNTENVTNMVCMFDDCRYVTTLDVSNFDTKNVTNMECMFRGCIFLTTLDVSNFDTKNVTNMGYMFDECYGLTTLDVSKFDTKNVTDMSWMFADCQRLRTIYASDKFVTTACDGDTWMFKGCYSLVGAVPYDRNKDGKEMANYATGYFTDIASKVAESYAVFDEATNTLTFKHDTKKTDGAFALNEGDNIPGWYIPNGFGGNKNYINKVVFDASFAKARPTSCYSWFRSCSDLKIEGIEYLNTENVTNMGCMFYKCYGLTTLDVSKFDTKNVTDMSWMFYDCYKLTTLDVSNFDTKNVTDMNSMFLRCSALTTIYASDKFVTTACEKDEDMFKGCYSLVGAVPYDGNKVGKEMANYTTGYFTYKATTGIDAPTVSDDTTAEYYDLQGRRLNAPQKGVNIVKRGKKTTKMLVK